MKTKVQIDKIYKPSEDVVAREIHGELILIPITSGIDCQDDDIFTFNETGRAVWEKLDGKKTLKDIKTELVIEFLGSAEEIENDILGVVEELLNKKMLLEVS